MLGVYLIYGTIRDCGMLYLNGEGVEQSNIRGIAMLGVAAGIGRIWGRSTRAPFSAWRTQRGAMGSTRTRRRPRGGIARCKTAPAVTPPRRIANRRRLGCSSTRRNAKAFFAPCVEASGALERLWGIFGTPWWSLCIFDLRCYITCCEATTRYSPLFLPPPPRHEVVLFVYTFYCGFLYPVRSS